MAKGTFQTKEGTIERNSGTLHGGVISPVIANLFLLYIFDKSKTIHHPKNPFARYVDDAVIHCKSEAEATGFLESLNYRMNECKLELHPIKTRIVYCKDEDRKENYETYFVRFSRLHVQTKTFKE
jgi:RNA-directed DNA polymerase